MSSVALALLKDLRDGTDQNLDAIYEQRIKYISEQLAKSNEAAAGEEYFRPDLVDRNQLDSSKRTDSQESSTND